MQDEALVGSIPDVGGYLVVHFDRIDLRVVLLLTRLGEVGSAGE